MRQESGRDSVRPGNRNYDINKWKVKKGRYEKWAQGVEKKDNERISGKCGRDLAQHPPGTGDDSLIAA